MASAPPASATAASAAEALALLASLYTPPFLVRLSGLPHGAGWRLELSEDNGSSWSSLEAGQPGHANPIAAIEAGAQAITLWRTSRVDASNAEISFYFQNGKLERRRILIDDPDRPGLKIQVDGYAAQDQNGEWVESVVPIEAINKAKEVRVRPGPSSPSSQPTQGQAKAMPPLSSNL